jgi:hypothetical protein
VVNAVPWPRDSQKGAYSYVVGGRLSELGYGKENKDRQLTYDVIVWRVRVTAFMERQSVLNMNACVLLSNP